MAEKERITNPSMGSNELGSELEEKVEGKGVSAGSDIQTQLAALSTENKKENKTDKPVNEKNPLDFPEANETDE